MAKALFNKLLNKDVNVEAFLNWLILKEENDKENSLNLEFRRADFVTYFLNFIHEEISSFCRDSEAHQQFTPKKLEKQPEDQKPLVNRRCNLISANKSSTNDKCNSFSFENNSLVDESVDNVNSSLTSASTPKNSKTNRNSPNHSLLSPISPLYKGNNSFSSPNNRKFENKCSPICLGDFLVNNSASSNKRSAKKVQKCGEERVSRRINPTNLGQKMKDAKSSFKTENSFNFQANQSSASELSVENIEEQRNLLAEERVKILSNRISIDSFNKIGLSNISSSSFNKEEVIPNLDLVSFKEQLNIAIEIYVAIVKNNFYLNLTSEIYFLMSMLICRQFENSFKTDIKELESSDDSKLFHSIHNIVYFAVQSINSLINFLKHIDKTTLKLIGEHERVKDFLPELSDKLNSISDNKTERIIEIIPEYKEDTNICFNLDTDNRNHFPNGGCFHAFRKQRDLFYEILRIWEVNHLLSGWNFTYGLAAKIRSLFGLNSEPANFMHLARLFKAQLLSNCSKSSKEDGLTETQLPILSFGNIDKDKLDRLKSRLVTKQTSNGISALPLFPGHQEFYREFIVVASNPIFNRHLCDSLIAELLELNETKFECSDMEDNDVDQNTRQSYLNCIRNLRLLAKFLGFTESLPYLSSVESYSDTLLESQVHLRKELQPNFDIQLILEKAVENQTLILTIPWLVKYFAMLDYVTLRLPYYKSVINLLFRIHNSIDEEKCAFYNLVMIKVSLGWLFELSHFPDNNYFNYCFQNHEPKLNFNNLNNLDGLPLIDQNLLYILCPYLDEIKKLLNSNSSSGNIRVKHITPVTALESPKEMAKKKIQHQLEEAFFNGQPISVRKTVEFVSERIASSSVKHICSNLVPDFKQETLKEFTEIAKEWKLNYDKLSSESEQNNFKVSIKQKYNALATEKFKLLLDIINKSIEDIVNEKVPISINGLMPIDTLKQVNDVCISITKRTCLDRIHQWINTHVTATVLIKDFDSEITKILNSPMKEIGHEIKPVFLLPAEGNGNKIHNENSLSAAHLLEKVKNITMDVMQTDVAISEEIIVNILDEAKITLSERIDVNECISTHMCMLFVDLSILLLTHTPIMSTTNVKLKFLDLWKCYYGNPENLFKNLICPRNIMILAQSSNVRKAWESLAEWSAFLIKHNFLSSECFESQCTGIFKRDWDPGTLKCLTNFLKAFIGCYRSNGGEYDKFTFLLEFLSDYCSDLF